MAKRVRDVDFGMLVAAAYMGNIVWASGLSSSIALASATPGSALNIIEKVTGQTAGFERDDLHRIQSCAHRAGVPAFPFMLIAMAPAKPEMKRADPELLSAQDAAPEAPAAANNFRLADRKRRILTLLLVGMGFSMYRTSSHARLHARHRRHDLLRADAGSYFPWRPIRYVRAFNRAARTVGPILLQFPLYGGIMGMMTGTGLAAVIAHGFVAFSTHNTLPFWTFVSSNIISLFVPSGGGHWAVQGPFMVPAAVELGVDPAVTAMATAMGEQTANMIQPFWALPVLAIAGLGIRDIMGYCVMALFLGLVLYGGALLIFA